MTTTVETPFSLESEKSSYTGTKSVFSETSRKTNSVGSPIKELSYDWSKNSGNVIVGIKNSDKSVLMMNLINRMAIDKKLDKLIIIGPPTQADKETSSCNPHYPSWASIYVPNDINSIYMYIVDNNNKQLHKLLIIDVPLNNINIKILNDLVYNGRHYNLTFFILQNYGNNLRPDLRNQIDYTFIVPDHNQSYLQSVWHTNCGMVATFQEFKQIINKMIPDYALVIKNSSNSDELNRLSKIRTGVFNFEEIPKIDTYIDVSTKNTDQKTYIKKKIIEEIEAIKNKLEIIVDSMDYLLD
jgi:hypothetical protein